MVPDIPSSRIVLASRGFNLDADDILSVVGCEDIDTFGVTAHKGWIDPHGGQPEGDVVFSGIAEKYAVDFFHSVYGRRSEADSKINGQIRRLL